MNRPRSSSGIAQAELESYLWGAAVLLRGLIDAGDYKGYIFPLVFLKRICDVWDEERRAALVVYGDEELADLPENHRFSIPSGAHWNDIRATTSNLGSKLLSSMRAIESANPDALAGVFGDADWTNKNLLSDAVLADLVEHFSAKTLSIANLPEDELGNGYEYLIKRFADDSGHTAQEFYTNRTLVHLMAQMLKPQPGESIYDPTCGTGGMLISCVAEVRNQGKDYRTLGLFGQERNHTTASIAKMNLFLHGVEDGHIIHGDTLANPGLLDEQGTLRKFDIQLANPPYSIKNWNREAFAHDPYGQGPALDFMLRSRTVSPEGALALGIVHELADSARARAIEVAAGMVRQSPVSLAAAKRSIWEGANLPLAEGLRIEAEEWLKTIVTDVAMEKMRDYVATPFADRNEWVRRNGVPPEAGAAKGA